MNTQHLGSSSLSVTRIASGRMKLGGSWDGTPLDETTRAEASRIVRVALDLGINFFDLADISTRPQRIWVCCESDSLELTREEWYRLFVCGRGEGLS